MVDDLPVQSYGINETPKWPIANSTFLGSYDNGDAELWYSEISNHVGIMRRSRASPMWHPTPNNCNSGWVYEATERARARKLL